MISWHSQLPVYPRVCGASLLHNDVGAFLNCEVSKMRVLDVTLIANRDLLPLASGREEDLDPNS